MNLQQWLAKIRLVGERTDLHERGSHRQMFIDLAALAIAAQDRGALPFAQDGLLTGYRSLGGDYLRQRARGVLLPRGLRLGVLDFTPIVQLAKTFDLGEVTKLDIVALPKGRRQLIDHFLGLIGIEGSTGEPAAFKTLFGFRIADYVAFLTGLRSTDAIAYTMLLAHEFKLASERLQDPGSFLWVERGATLAELARLVDIVRHLDGRPASIDDVRTALRALKRPSRNYSLAEQQCIERAQSLTQQMGYGVEALRALFLGDRAGPALVAAPDWRVASRSSQIQAASRCALFAKNTPMIVPGFRARPKRFVRGRRRSAYSYYGVSLDMLLLVGIKDLATACGQPGGVQALTSLAEEIAGGLTTSGTYKGSLCSQRDACNAAVHAELYLRERGHGGAGARFDWQGWFDSSLDDAFYGRLWTRFVISNRAHGADSVHGQIDSLLQAMKPLLGGHCMPSVDVAPSLAGRVMSQLACGLTPWSMDPLFAALLERSLIERGCRVGLRADPARKRSGAKRSFLLALLRSSAVRQSYCRFEDVHGRLNHDPDAEYPRMLAAQRALPVPLRRAAN